MDCYVISLKEPKQLLHKLQLGGFNVRLFGGINGANCEPNVISENINSLYSFFAPWSVMGCAISHFKVWEEFIKSGKEYCVVYEDDVIINDLNITTTIQKLIKRTPRDFDILSLGWFGSICNDNVLSDIFKLLGINRNFIEVNNEVIIPEVSLGNHAYIISQTGANKLLQLLKGKLWNHLDYCIQELSAQGKLNVYCARERLVYQTSTDTLDSTNVSSHHPILIQEMFSDTSIDKGLKLSYLTTVSIARIGSVNLNVTSILFLVLGIIVLWTKTKLQSLIIFFIIISLPDLLTPMNSQIMLHLFLLVLPSLLSHGLKT